MTKSGMSNKSFIIRKLEWMEAVAADIHEWLPLAVAVKLAARYFNNQSETAWPGIDRLAEELGTHRRNIQRAMDVLVDAGWLERERERRGGRNKSNTYRLKGGSHAAVYDAETAAHVAINSGSRGKKTAAHAPPEPEKEPKKEPARVARAQEPNFASLARKSKTPQPKKGKPPLAKKTTSFPQDWVLGEKELNYAFNDAGWDVPQANQQFVLFRNWYKQYKPYNHDWDAAWHNWCIRGPSFDSKKPETNLQANLKGFKAWIDS